MKFITNILYLEFSELTSCGISDNTLKSVKNKGTIGWRFISDPEDGRKVLVEYERLKPKYKNMVLAKFGNPYTYIASTALEKYIKTDYDARFYFSNYELPNGNKLSDEYIDKYTQCAELLNFLSEIRSKNGKKIVKQIAPDKTVFWQMIAEYIDKKGIDLPKAYTRILEKVRQYKDEQTNYEVLISGKFGLKNSEKINEDASEWLIAQYSMFTTTLNSLFIKYNREAQERGWKAIAHINTLYMFLHKEDIQPQWYLGRYGKLKFIEKYGYQLKTILPNMRDALWYGDGTKLNYYYLNEKGEVATMYVYEVIDVYSEYLLGYAIGDTENFQMQYDAYKMAINFAGQKPYEIRYDNQGGHKKIKDSFLSKLSKVGFACQPYNAKSKTIESIFGRFQTQFLKQDWFFTGQNITAKKLESKHNRAFIYEHKKMLPTKQEVIATYEQRRKEWNESKHPKVDCSRIERYLNSENPKADPVDLLQMIELFWLMTDKPITYYTSGITLTVSKQKYEYEVLKNGMPDMEFRSKNIDRKFYIKYDPTDLSHIRLYRLTHNGLEFVAGAEPRIEVHRATQEHDAGEKQLINDLLGVRTEELKRAKKQHEEREDKTGISIYNQMNGSIGEIMKHESNMLYEDEEFDVWQGL